MKVLVVSQYFWPESFRIVEVVESLRELGCTITVLTGQPNYPKGEVFPGYKSMGAGLQLHPSGYEIYRVPIVPRGKASATALAANYLSFIITASICGSWLLRKHKFDVVFVYGTSPITQAIPAMLIAALKRAKLITWVQDLWPESLEATGFVRNQHILAIVRHVVQWIYSRCDLLLVQSEAFFPAVRAMSGNTPLQFHPNPGELAFQRANPSHPPALILEKSFNVVLAGNLGTVQGLETVLNCAECLQHLSDIHFVLVGSGSRSGWLEDEVERRGLLNVRLPGRFEAAEMPYIFAQASVLLVTLTKNIFMAKTVPSKIQTYLAAGKPIIASLDGEAARIVVDSGAGLACPAEDCQALTRALLELRALPRDELERMGEAGKAYYEEHFEPTRLAKKLLNIFSEA